MVTVVFDQPMVKPSNITAINETVLDLKITTQREGMKDKLGINTWKVTSKLWLFIFNFIKPLTQRRWR